MDTPYRIIHKARAYGIPSENSFLAETPPERFCGYLSRLPENSNIGEPVLVFVRDHDNWSFLASKGIGGFTAGEYREIAYSDVEGTSGFPPDGVPMRKRELHALEVTSKGRTFKFEASPGEEFFALWNLLMKISHPIRKGYMEGSRGAQ